MSTQSELAEILRDELEISGHDDISVLDLLDCLGMAGLVLAIDPVDGEAMMDYLAEVPTNGPS